MLLGFGHKARQGKDSAAEAIVEYYNKRRDGAIRHGYYKSNPTSFPEARQFRFADELYRVCREEYGMTEKDAPLLQKVGNDRRNEFGLTYWIDKVTDKLKDFKGIAVISDVRYKNEADWVKSNHGYLINVRRVNRDGTPYFATDRDPNFISEIDLDGYPYDHYIQACSGDSVLVAEIAITIAEFIRGRGAK